MNFRHKKGKQNKSTRLNREDIKLHNIQSANTHVFGHLPIFDNKSNIS